MSPRIRPLPSTTLLSLTLSLTLTLTLTLLLLLLLPIPATSTPTPLPSPYPGPTPVIAHFPFDVATYPFTSQYNTYATTPPRSANAQSPTLVAAQSAVACPFGGSCASFGGGGSGGGGGGGGGSYLEVTPWVPLLGAVDGAVLGSWSVGVWVKSEQAGWQGVLGVWGSGAFVWSLRLYNNQPHLIWVFRDASQAQTRIDVQSAQAVSSTAWTHLVVTYNATSHNVQFWISGVLTDTFPTTAAYSYLGGQSDLGWKVGLIEDVMYAYVGGMDELWMFADVLTGDEVLLLRAINSIGSCAPGSAGVAQYRVGTCTNCQPGTFAPDIGTLVCQVCPAGTAASNSHAFACQACPAGTYAPTTNSTQCLACPAGTYSPTPGSTACLPCTAGTYSTTPASTTCAYCPTNTLSPPAATLATSCAACPAGSTGGASVPVCCANGVSAAGALLASVGVGLGGFGVQNACVLSLDVSQTTESMVELVSDYCGLGYDSVLTSSLQNVYGEFSAFQAQADQAALQRVYCNP